MNKIAQSASQMTRWRERPDLMVRELFDVEPDPWQDEALRAFPTHPRIAMKAAKGPGKTATLSWLAWNFLLTRPHPNIAATSISADNLRDGLWKEMHHWRSKAPLLQARFEITGERVFQRDNPATWFMSARSWSKSANTEDLGKTLAGLHTDYIMFLLDESGGMPVAITAAAEAGLSSCVEGHIVQAGNTNTLDGALYMACVKQAHLWKVIVISSDPDDPKRSTRVSIDWARDMIKAYGRESSYIKVMILGEWPEASLNALLGPNDVEAAMKRQYQEWDIEKAPRILGVDVALEGDDRSVIFPRQGLVAFKPHIMRNARSDQGAGQVARVWRDWDVNAAFVDNTGGFGAGWIDQLRLLNRAAIPVGFAEEAEDKGRYFNRRAEMYFRMAEWVKNGGHLPNIPELVAELTETTYTHRGDRLLLEPKKLIKARLGRSPDLADGLALTFAATVAPREQQVKIAVRAETEFNPFEQYFKV